MNLNHVRVFTFLCSILVTSTPDLVAIYNFDISGGGLFEHHNKEFEWGLVHYDPLEHPPNIKYAGSVPIL